MLQVFNQKMYILTCGWHGSIQLFCTLGNSLDHSVCWLNGSKANTVNAFRTHTKHSHLHIPYSIYLQIITSTMYIDTILTNGLDWCKIWDLQKARPPCLRIRIHIPNHEQLLHRYPWIVDCGTFADVATGELLSRKASIIIDSTLLVFLFMWNTSFFPVYIKVDLFRHYGDNARFLRWWDMQIPWCNITVHV